MNLFGARGKDRQTGADVGGVRGLFGARVLDELVVMADGGRGLTGLLELTRQVVVGGRVARIDFDGAAQTGLRVVGLPQSMLGQREIHQRVGVARLLAQRDARLCRRGIELP